MLERETKRITFSSSGIFLIFSPDKHSIVIVTLCVGMGGLLQSNDVVFSRHLLKRIVINPADIVYIPITYPHYYV